MKEGENWKYKYWFSRTREGLSLVQSMLSTDEEETSIMVRKKEGKANSHRFQGQWRKSASKGCCAECTILCECPSTDSPETAWASWTGFPVQNPRGTETRGLFFPETSRGRSSWAERSFRRYLQAVTRKETNESVLNTQIPCFQGHKSNE